jgi:radical SAM superfamily enzyme YgiQ (UPF0313 family)
LYSGRKDIDILLIPPVLNPVLFTDFTNFVPVGLLALLSSLSEAGYIADIYKPRKTLLSAKDYQFVAKNIAGQKCRSIGFSTWCHSFPDAIMLVRELKKIAPDLPTIFGGPQVSALDLETMTKYKEIDYILRGEADESLPLLLGYIFNGTDKIKIENIPGLTYRDISDGFKIIRTSPPPFISELNKLPVPAYEKIIDKNALRLDAGRGCPFHCTYCSTNQFFSRKYRMKSFERIIMEMEVCQRKLGIDHIGLSHDTLTVSNKFIEELSAGLRKFNSDKKNPIYWSCSSRTDCITEDMITAMYKSGCRAMFMGIESGSPRMQKKIRKNLVLNEAHRIIKHAVQLGMKITVSYIIGFPDETEEDVEKTLKSIINMAMLGVEPQMALLSILPGTQLYTDYIDQLEYDGKTFGMTGSFLTGMVMDMVKTDRKLFSSFYYVPCKFLKRDDLVFINNIINLLFLFLPTFKILREFLGKDVSSFPLYRYIIRMRLIYQNDASIHYPELFCLVDSIRKYLRYITSKGLQEYMLDIFKADLTKAYMQVKYNNWQYSRAGDGLPVKPKKISNTQYIKVLPFWRVISVNFNIFQYINDPLSEFNKKTNRKGNYHYVVLPMSENHTRLFKVSSKHKSLIKNLYDMPVYKFLEENKSILNRNKARQFLMKLNDLGMIEIKTDG